MLVGEHVTKSVYVVNVSNRCVQVDGVAGGKGGGEGGRCEMGVAERGRCEMGVVWFAVVWCSDCGVVHCGVVNASM